MIGLASSQHVWDMLGRMRYLFMAHSGLRYLILLADVAWIAVAAAGLLLQRPGPKGVRISGAIFVGLLDLQVLLGLGLFAGGYYSPRSIGHLAMMVLATATAHATHVLGRKRPNGTYRWPLIGGVAAAALIALGIHAIGRGILQSTAGI